MKSIIDKIRDCEFEDWMFVPIKPSDFDGLFEPMEETETKSDTPQLTVIAATILTGLLASGDYTEGAEHFPAYQKGGAPRARYRPEAVNDAIELTLKLVKGLRSVGAVPNAPQAPPAAQE
jgi:hypothetical protein